MSQPQDVSQQLGTATRTPLSELAALFLRLGAIGFGGPAAHIALMDDEVVRRKRWMTRQQFLDYVGATNLIPGPNSTELAIHIGHAQAGWPGLLVAGASFILPAVIVVGGIAWGYVRFGALPDVAWILYGVKTVVLAVMAQALISFARTAIKTMTLATVAGASAAAVLMGVHELVVLAAAAFAMIVMTATTARPLKASSWSIALAASGSVYVAGQTAVATIAGATASGIFLSFLKIGAVLFGSGYVLLAFLRTEFVLRLGWLTEPQLLDAIAVGQITPGPVFTTATFVGYLLAGWPGALAATVGIFLPAFFFVAVSGPLIPRIRASRLAGGALDGVNVASLALMAVVSAQLARAAIVDGPTGLIAAGSLFVLVRYRVNSAWLVAGGAATGWLLQAIA